MNIWKITISREDIRQFDEYYGLAEKATTAAAKALKVATKDTESDKNFNDELYVSEISYVGWKRF